MKALMDVLSRIKIEEWVLLATLLVLIIQVWMQRRDLRKQDYRHQYNRWFEISLLEIEHPIVHRMLMDMSFQSDLEQLDDDSIKERALALVLFDQFAMIFRTGDRYSIYTRLEPYVRWLLRRSPRLSAVWRNLREANKTIWEYNEAYIRGIVINPTMRRCWCEYRLRDTWIGDDFYDFVESAIAEADGLAHPSTGGGPSSRPPLLDAPGEVPADPSGPKEISAFLLLVLVSLIWGAGFSAVKWLLAEQSAVALITYRSLFSIPVIAGLLLFRRKRQAESQHVVPGLVLGLLLGGALLIQAMGLQQISASKSGLITGICIPLTPLLGWIVLRTRVAAIDLAAAALATVGVCLLAYPLTGSVKAGDLLTAAAAGLLALHIVGTGWAMRNIPDVDVLLLLLFEYAAVACVGGLGWVFSRDLTPLLMSPAQWLVFGFLVLLVSVGGYVGQAIAQKRLTTTHTAVVLSLEPLSAMVVGFIFLHELLTTHQFLGGMLVVLAIFVPQVVSSGTSRQSSTPTS